MVQYRPHVQLWYDMLGHMLCDVRVCTFECLAEVTALRPCFIHCDLKKWTVVIFSITPSNSSPYYIIRGRQLGAEAAFRPNMLPLVHQLVTVLDSGFQGWSSKVLLTLLIVAEHLPRNYRLVSLSRFLKEVMNHTLELNAS